jgi:hypothetical protein
MNKARREATKALIQSGATPKEAYDTVKYQKGRYAHAVWIKGALFRVPAVRKGVTNE